MNERFWCVIIAIIFVIGTIWGAYDWYVDISYKQAIIRELSE